MGAASVLVNPHKSALFIQRLESVLMDLDCVKDGLNAAVICVTFSDLNVLPPLQ